jgi:hypothetical protein
LFTTFSIQLLHHICHCIWICSRNINVHSDEGTNIYLNFCGVATEIGQWTLTMSKYHTKKTSWSHTELQANTKNTSVKESLNLARK